MDERALWADEPDTDRLRRACLALDQDPKGAVTELHSLIDGGSIMGMVYLGYAFEKGLGVEKDISTAMAWYERAAQQGSLLAKSYLAGLLVARGQYDEAQLMLSDTDLRDDPASMFWMATILLKKKTHIDDVLRILEEASRRGHIPSQRMLGGLLIHGYSGSKNIPKGVWLFIKSVLEAFSVAKQDPRNPRLRI